MTIDTVKKLAALAAGVGCGPLSLRLFTILRVPVGGPARDSVAPLAFWLASSPIAQVCAAALFIGGSGPKVAARFASFRAVARGAVSPLKKPETGREAASPAALY